MHQKVILPDDKASVIGTVNFDNHSFRLNFEVSGIVVDREFAGGVEQILLSNTTKVRDYKLENESLWERVKAHDPALLAPVL